MSTFVLPLPDPDALLKTVGGKGMSLAILARAGLPVPGGFHITTAAYRCFVSENGLQPRILAALQGADRSDPADPQGPLDPARLESISQQIRQVFITGTIPPEIIAAVSAAYAALPGKTIGGNGKGVPALFSVAVRSSATAEDLPGASFAGQQETYLNIRGVEAVLEAVKKCWASLWTARAIAYRARQGIDPESVALAVVVQELVFADAAGVLFTANPITGKRDEIVINAAWGLGEAIVSGAVTPDTLTVEKATGKVIRRETTEKQVMTIRTETCTSQVPVPDSQKKKAVLTNGQAAELAKDGVEIENLYGQPMDIEWALAEGRFAILQARPITALPEPPLEWLLSQPHTIASRTSFVEFVPDAVSPLFATLAIPLATQATSKMMADVLGIRGKAGYYFEVVNGYVYNCLNTSTILQYGLFGILGTSKILRYGKLRREEVQVNSRRAANKWRQVNLAALPAADLLAGTRELFGITVDYFTVAQSGPIPLSSMSEALFSLFYDALVKRKSDPSAATFLLGLENLPLQSEKSLFDLAQWAQGQADLADYLRQTPAQVVWDALKADPNPAPLSGEFAARLAAHLAAFGHVVYDLDFSRPVPADDPLPVLDTLKVYLTGQGGNPHTRLQAQAEQRRQAERAISMRLDPLRRKWFQKLLKSAQDCAPERENAIADLGLTYPQIRRLLRELGQRLVAGGALVRLEDVYWLEAQEVDTLAASLDKHEMLTSYATSVALRQAHWQRARQAAPPPALPVKSRFARLMTHKKLAGNSLKGYGASAGQITAPACVLRGPEDFEQMRPGDVIVAVTTTPAWTPLFAMASAVVTDIGGPLSHSSIVAREYGIPAVMATGEGTRCIHTGQMITVDGSAGTVMLKG